MAAAIPKKIGKYDVIDVVGKGGMGVVYRAKDPFLDRMVAIKIMTISYADYPDLLQRFYREAKATANLQHPNIVTVYELGEHEGSPYLAMQFLEGASLESLVRSGQPLSFLQKLDIIIQACHGLSYAHQKGIVHRDIKPGNIMVLKDGNVKIVDFGIARIGDTNFTRTGQFMGSLNYMSLEQLNDKLTVDQRTDVYSTGVVLYQILTGSLPFEAESTGATLMKILNENPAPFSKYNLNYPPETEVITMKALAKDRDQRYSSADELALDLTQLVDRLKVDQVNHHLRQAEAFLQQNSLFQANDELLAVLKLDKQNTKASGMLRTLRKQIEKEQSSERARQLREQAEEAARREDYDTALGFADQALQLDSTNTDLQQLKAKVQAAKAEIEHLRQVMQRAENAHRSGNLDTAKQCIDEVAALRPNDTRVKSLQRLIQKELDDRMRQKRMENLLDSARKEMSNRRYTAALDILKEAEKVDPDAPALRSLLDSLNASREQEQRRAALEQLTRQVEQAINTDDNQTALNLLGEGIKKFPGEAALLKLKDLAESQAQTAQLKSFVKERIAAAREILNAGNATGALKVLQEALKKAPGNPHLESLVAIAQERLVQDRDDQAKSRCIQQANEAIGKRAYTDAIRILEAGQIQFTASPEIDNLLRFAREQQTRESQKQEVENSVRRAQEFLKNQEYDRAIELLESILAKSPDEELGIVLEEARRRREALNQQISAAINRGYQFLNEGSPAKTVEFLQAQPTAYRRSDEFRKLLENAQKKAKAAPSPKPEPAKPEPAKPEIDLEAPEPSKTMMWSSTAPPEEEKAAPPKRPAEKVAPASRPAAKPAAAAPEPRKSSKLLAIGAVAGLVLVIVLAVVFWPSGPKGAETHPKTSETASTNPQPPQPPPPTPVATGVISVQTNVDNVDVYIDKDPKRTTNGKQLDVTLPVGDHSIRVLKDQYKQEPARTVHVAKDQPTKLSFTLSELTVKPGFIEIASAPGAAVKIDGTSWGTIAQDGKLRVQIEPKPRAVVEVTADGAEAWTKTVGPVAADQTVHVDAPLRFRPPTVDSFTGPSEVQQGQPVRLGWKTTNATSVDIEGIGTGFGPNDSKDATPSQPTTYRLVAKGPGGSSSPSTVFVNVKVAPKAPIVTSFSASATTIKQGDSVILAWSTSDAQSVSIDNGVGNNLAPSGTRQISPAQSTTFRLTATGPGGTNNATASVAVEPKTEAKNPEPPKPTNDTSSGTKSDTQAIQDALSRLTASFLLNQLVSDVKKEWTGMTSRQEKQLNDDLQSSGMKSYRVEYDHCSAPVITGTAATIKCTGTTKFTRSGKPDQRPPQPYTLSLKKGSDNNWHVDTIVYAGK